MMLGFQASSSSSKVYRCVACSATFTGLASLLVHQASHANTLSKVSTPPQHSVSPQETLSAGMDSSSGHPATAATRLPESPSPSFYICDCGEEFQDFTLMLEHKRSHVSQPDNNNCNSFPTQRGSFSPTVNQTDLVLSSPSTSKPPAVELPTEPDRKADINLEDDIAIETTSQGQYNLPQDSSEEPLENMSATAEQLTETVEDMDFHDKTIPALTNDDEYLPRKESLMKLLASAYMNRFKSSSSLNQGDDAVAPQQEIPPCDITPGTRTEIAPANDLSVAQLRRLLAAPGIKTKAPSITRVLESSRKRVVSLTKTFSPVVVLETRQKLKEPGMNGTYGKYQCGRCRRVFQNLDRLTEHHFLHKKERIKCCRRCKQLIIGRLPLPDNHICPQLGNKSMQMSGSIKNRLFAQKLVPFHSLNNTRKVFFCPLCKHSYARRWNLKKHKCQGHRVGGPQQASASFQRMLMLRSNGKAVTDAAGSPISKSVAVGTDVTSHIKIEANSPNLEESSLSQLTWTNPANSFPPFYPRSSVMDAHRDAFLPGVFLQTENENDSWDAAVDDEESNEGQWTMPLDDEIDVEKAYNEAGAKKAGSVETVPSSLRYFVRDGVKRYPCNRCQKTYSRPSTLRRHLRLCGFRPRGSGAMFQGGSANALLGITNKPMFPCFVCGKTFNRKDNMMAHRKRCHLRQTMTDGDGRTEQISLSANATDCHSQEEEGGNWSIMSLPSVLPRRVTCECGVGFTSPRLLLEHLQKHAQESYTCPTCGETVNSWADYEVHLQIHMHPHHQLLQGLQPQRSQPLLLRFQQQPQQQPSQTVHQSPQKQTVRAEQPPNPPKKQQRIVCTRCGNTFATRCSLRRHLSWNRCKGARLASQSTNPPKTHHCSHCNSDFPNTISLLFHQRSGACKPAIKPVRCPVCLRWFGTVDGLQKHLLTHKQSDSYRCDVCQGTYPSLKSLKNHRRRIHRIMAGDIQPKAQEQLTS